MERLCYLQYYIHDILSDVRVELKCNVYEVAMLNQKQQYQERLIEFIHRVVSVKEVRKEYKFQIIKC